MPVAQLGSNTPLDVIRHRVRIGRTRGKTPPFVIGSPKQLQNVNHDGPCHYNGNARPQDNTENVIQRQFQRAALGFSEH
jgi:hypothetical protein